MEDAPLKKIVTVAGQSVELFSLDGETWGTNLRELKQREERLAKERQKAAEYSKRIFPSSRYLAKL